MTEFELIDHYFRRPSQALLGIGDDAAVVALDELSLITQDMMVQGIHFFDDADPVHVGHKLAAVNLSDIAAMGGTPRYALLSLALPNIDHVWLEGFSRGLLALLEQHQVELIGGDTSASRAGIFTSLSLIGTSAMPPLKRSGAQVGDDVWVSGTLGGAAAALADQLGQLTLSQAREAAHQELLYPEPQLALGQLLLPVAHSLMDLSDGLWGDAAHLCRASKVGMWVEWSQLPLHPALAPLPLAWQQRLALSGGEDYQLLFTASPHHRDTLAQLPSPSALSRIGQITATTGLQLKHHGQDMPSPKTGYQHFRQR